MSIFNLPDLGEGLPDAEIHEWFIKEGDDVKLDQPMVAMETAKAVVEVPAPQSGVIAKIHGQVGDIIKTGAPLVEFAGGAAEPAKTQAVKEDAGTVVGNIKVADKVLDENPMGIMPSNATSSSVKAIPAVRRLAAKLNVDLTQINGTGPAGRISAADVKRAKDQGQVVQAAASTTPQGPSIAGATPLRGVRRAMATAMAQSHRDIVPVTIIDDADIHAWPKKTDITYRVIRAIANAVKAEPNVNGWFDTKALAHKPMDTINLGLALDSPDGLFVPVIKDIANSEQTSIRETINRFKNQVADRSIPQDDLQEATIVLSNFGSIAGRYANPVIPPPCVAIVGTGKIHDAVVAVEGQAQVHRIMPLALTVDHRAITGGEATRFLKALIDDLILAE